MVIKSMTKEHFEHKKAKITTGPFLIPEEVDSEIQIGRNNDRIIIILKNPTDKKLKASVTLGVCKQPSDDNHNQEVHVFKNIPEKEINLGSHELKPHTCTRIERNIQSNERNAVFRVTATGDFKICDDTCEPICGLLEISVIGGSVFNPEEPGLEQADSATFFRYKDFVFCKDKDCC